MAGPRYGPLADTFLPLPRGGPDARACVAHRKARHTHSPPRTTETARTTTTTLSGRDRAILRAVATGGAELQLGTEPDLFFDGQPLNESDPVLNAVPDPAIRARLIARRVPAADAAGTLAYELTVVLRGELETPFFDDDDVEAFDV